MATITRTKDMSTPGDLDLSCGVCHAHTLEYRIVYDRMCMAYEVSLACSRCSARYVGLVGVDTDNLPGALGQCARSMRTSSDLATVTSAEYASHGDGRQEASTLYAAVRKVSIGKTRTFTEACSHLPRKMRTRGRHTDEK